MPLYFEQKRSKASRARHRLAKWIWIGLSLGESMFKEQLAAIKETKKDIHSAEGNYLKEILKNMNQ